jgi:hypothetical protein
VVTRHRPTHSARRCTAAILAAPCRLEAGVTIRTASILPAGRGYRRQAGAPSVRNFVRRRAAHHLSLARRQDTLSTGKSPNFLPVGRDFTIPARNFLPVGKGLQRLPDGETKRHAMSPIGEDETAPRSVARTCGLGPRFDTHDPGKACDRAILTLISHGQDLRASSFCISNQAFSPGIKGSRNHQSEGSQVLRASSAGTR